MANVLIVGGSGRNVGKTEFVCRLIEKISATTDIYALKVSAVYPDEHLYHGEHPGEGGGRELFEELRLDSAKDTSRMLRAGAKRVFYLRSDGSDIARGFHTFLGQIPADSLIICESNSLNTVVRPALLVVVRTGDGAVKPRAIPLLAAADLVVVSAGSKGFAELARISCGPAGGWRLD